MSSPTQDPLIRMALACMTADPASTLTSPERQWLCDRLHRLDALTPAERAQLQTLVLAWFPTRQRPEPALAYPTRTRCSRCQAWAWTEQATGVAGPHACARPREEER